MLSAPPSRHRPPQFTKVFTIGGIKEEGEGEGGPSLPGNPSERLTDTDSAVFVKPCSAHTPRRTDTGTAITQQRPLTRITAPGWRRIVDSLLSEERRNVIDRSPPAVAVAVALVDDDHNGTLGRTKK